MDGEPMHVTCIFVRRFLVRGNCSNVRGVAKENELRQSIGLSALRPPLYPATKNLSLFLHPYHQTRPAERDKGVKKKKKKFKSLEASIF
jgi:hypothetical protein